MFVKPHKLVRLLYPSLIWKKKIQEKTVWLTFDDGPHKEVTPWILSILAEEKITATFFLVGQQIIKFPELVGEIEKKGHVIGNHSFSHLNGWTSYNKIFFKDIEKCQKLIPQNTLFRPPYGKLCFSQIQKLKRKYKLILWDVLSLDFKETITSNEVQSNVLNNVESGSIIVFHNNEKSFKKLKPILKETISELKNRGYDFSTIW